jgi:lipoprotein signal peptidase
MSQLALYVNERGKCVMHYSGFSWLAGIALVVWALQRRLYLVAAIALVYGVAWNVFIIQLSQSMQVILWALQFVVVGALANRLHRILLERRGWLRTEEELPAKGNTDS